MNQKINNNLTSLSLVLKFKPFQREYANFINHTFIKRTKV